MKSKWFRVTRTNPCRVCTKPDWCGYTEDGAACCMRIESARPMRNGGWLHVSGATPRPVKAAPVVFTPTIDAVAIMRSYDHDPYRVAILARSIGVTVASLLALGCAWAEPHHAWAFPMCNSSGKPVGIRLRTDEGRKFAVKGSRQGIFMSQDHPGHTAFICEGPTDTAAALSIGCYALGRPSCSGGLDEIRIALQDKGVHRMVVVSDNDSPGIKGAERLVSMVHMPSCIFTPPAKDMREFVRNGGTMEVIEQCLKCVVWNTRNA